MLTATILTLYGIGSGLVFGGTAMACCWHGEKMWFLKSLLIALIWPVVLPFAIYDGVKND